MRTFWIAIVLILGGFVLRADAARPTTVPVTASIDPSSIDPDKEATVTVTVDVPEGLHAQSHTPSEPNYIKFEVTLDKNPAFEAQEPQYPPGEDQTYPQLGKLNVYSGQVVTKVPIKLKPNAPGGALKVSGRVQIQMCDDRSCYPPQKPTFSVEATVTGNNPPIAAEAEPPVDDAKTQAAGEGKKQWTVLTAFGAALLAGMLFNIMPCVLPVLPLKIVGFYEAAQHSRARSFLLGLVFSFGVISLFALLAVIILILGAFKWGDLFTYGWFVWSMVILLVVLSLGLFGGWTFSLPVGVYRLEARHDTVGGNFFWGFLTAILATPCTAPLLPGVMAWALIQPRYVGVPAVLMVGVGMALPYLVLSAMPEVARKFPRTGPWSELFKQMMGFLLLASAMYFAAGRLIHGPQFWWAVTAVIAAGAVFLVGRTIQLMPTSRAITVSSVIAVLMLGAMMVWTLRITARSGEWHEYSDADFNSLRSGGKPVLVKFTANWCGTCQLIEGNVYRDPEVWKQIQRHDVTPMKVDFSTSTDAPGRDLLLSLNPTGGIPLTAIYGPSGKEPVVLESVYSTAELLRALDQATGTAVAAR
jgi:thiol:disulfide interchange protein